MYKKRQWGLAIFSTFWLLTSLVVNSAAGQTSNSVGTAAWFLVIIYAISGNLGAIANIAKLVSILQAVVGIAGTVWLANDPSMQGYFGTPFEFIFAIGIPTVLWIILFYWATAKMDQQKKLGSTTLENKIGSDKKNKAAPTRDDINKDKLTESAYLQNQLENTKSPLENLIEIPEELSSIPQAEASSLYPKAELVVEYSSLAASVWDEVKKESEVYSQKFMQALELDPKCDPRALFESIKNEISSDQNPYDDLDANKFLGMCRSIGNEAEVEFRNVYELLSGTVPAEEIYEKVFEKFDLRSSTAPSKIRHLHSMSTRKDFGATLTALKDVGCKVTDDGFSYGGTLSIFTPYNTLKVIYERDSFYLFALGLVKKLAEHNNVKL